MSTYSVSRNALIPAAPAVIFPLINDFHEWTAWSPWESLDTNMRRSYSGSTSGPGARYEWQGNRRAVRRAIIERDHPRRVGGL